MSRFERALDLPGISQKALWEFHQDPAVLASLSPPEKRIQVVRRPEQMGEGAELVIRVRQFGAFLEWVSVIEVWDPPVRFVDIQKKGPFSSWRHEHLFEDGRLTDRVDYEVPLARFGGRAVERLVVRPDLEKMFAYRHQRTREILLGRQ